MKVFVREKDFYKSVIHIAAPVVLQNLISIGVNMMDTIMLGRYGEFQLSGSSLGNEFIKKLTRIPQPLQAGDELCKALPG